MMCTPHGSMLPCGVWYLAALELVEADAAVLDSGEVGGFDDGAQIQRQGSVVAIAGALVHMANPLRKGAGRVDAHGDFFDHPALGGAVEAGAAHADFAVQAKQALGGVDGDTGVDEFAFFA